MSSATPHPDSELRQANAENIVMKFTLEYLMNMPKQDQILAQHGLFQLIAARDRRLELQHRIDEHVAVIKNKKELDGVGFATWSHARRSSLRAELAALGSTERREVADE